MENNKKIVVYTGLTIPFDEAKEILDGIYKPPIKRGELFDLIENEKDIDIILIIDGQFHNTPAVAHKEIMLAMDKGITVVGASSMGALRASELDTLGMIGIGYVYNGYRSGKIKSDDDVAVILNPETYEALSEALVNIDYKLEGAVREGIITDTEKEDLHNIAKSIYYPHRTYAKIFKESSLSEDKKNKLIRYINQHEDIKKQDAIEALKYVKKLAYEK